MVEIIWYGIIEFNVPLDTVQVISETIWYKLTAMNRVKIKLKK